MSEKIKNDTRHPELDSGSNIPKLRFPEFRDSGEWEEKALGKCLLKHPDYGVNAAAVPFSKNLPTYLRITDISVDGYYLNNEKVSVNIDATSDNYLEEGDIVLARTGASVGKSYKYKKEDGALVFAGFLIRVKPDKTKLSSDLLFHFLSTEKYWKWVNVVSARSGQPGINGNEYANLPIPIPSTLNEQQKIADCLSSVDSLILALSKKVGLLKEHKKALMQQLFPQDGEEVPKLRFPEFINATKWEEKKLGEVGEILNNRRMPISSDMREKGLYPYYGASGVVDYIKDYIFDERLLLIGEDGAKWGAFENTAFIAEGKYWVNNHAHVLRTTKINDVLLQNYLNMLDISPFITGAAPPKLTLKNLKDIPIPLPKPEEQQKIADCLSSIDEQISSQTQKLKTLKEHKKALMQQLFPSKEV